MNWYWWLFILLYLGSNLSFFITLLITKNSSKYTIGLAFPPFGILTMIINILINYGFKKGIEGCETTTGKTD